MKTETKELKVGDKVRTVYGKIETVSLIKNDCQIFTIESKGNWYHPSKVFKISEDK